MSSTTATMLYPALPPTNNTLDREERSRLLRSSRKLGAVLGTTPFVVEPELVAPSPRMPRTHREGRIFHTHSFSQSSSSSDASSTTVVSRSGDSDYVFVRSTTRSAPYQVQAIFDNASPSSSRSASPFSGVVVPRATGVGVSPETTSVSRKRKQNIGAGVGAGEGLAPLNMMFPIPGPASSKQTRSGSVDAVKDNGKGAMGAAHPSQPLLLRLRSVPSVPTPESENGHINNRDPLSDSDSPPKPLSPVASTFNISMSVDIVPPSPSSMDHGMNGHAHGLSDREKRRKMAKLARTLGENIPPELVFRAAPPTSYSSSHGYPSTSSASSTTAQPLKNLLRRTSSLTASKSLQTSSMPSSSNVPLDPVAPFNHQYSKSSSHSHSHSQFIATASLPPLAVAAAPLPIQPAHSHAHSQSQSERRHRQPQQLEQRPAPFHREEQENTPKRRQHRPRSLTLGTASAFAAAAAALTRGSSANASIPAAAKAAPAPAPAASTRRAHSPERTPTLESTRIQNEIYSRGTTSFDLPSPRPRLDTPQQPRAQTYYAAGGAPFEPLPSPRPFVHVAHPGSDARVSEDSVRSGEGLFGTGTEISLTMEWGRRKEREWSGEWNLKDMEDVAKKLRGLKGR